MPLEKVYPGAENERFRKKILASQEIPEPDLQDLSGIEGEALEIPQSLLNEPSGIADGLHELPDGSLVVGEEESQGSDTEEDDFYDNLASKMDLAALSVIADDLCQKIDADEKSMKPWVDKVINALAMLGADKDEAAAWIRKGAPFEGSATVVHPMLAEAVVQFNARAMKELMPPKGPVKTLVKGQETEEIREKAERVQEHMNHQMVHEDESYYDDMDRLLFYLPFCGSAFKKTYRDRLKKKTVSRFIVGNDVICPYVATSVEDSPRVTHRFKENHNDFQKKVNAGIYVDYNIQQAETQTSTELHDRIKESEGRTPHIADGDQEHEMLETYVHLDLEEADALNELDGIAVPYIVTIEKTERKIVSIYRNWELDDELYEPECWMTHFKFLPGLGMYGFGFLHLIGDLSEAATGALRALLDSAAFANVQGGFVAKGSKIKKGEFKLKMGVWQHVDTDVEDLNKAFFTPPFREPSRALFDLLSLLEDGGRRFMSTVDVAVGDAKNTGPVGTTVALIEQATKIMSGVHSRIHRSQTKEFKLRAKINRRYMPEEGIEYLVIGDSRRIDAEDYDEERVEIIPVSDPNVSSQTEKIAKAQVLLERAATQPGLYDAYRVEKQFLEATGISDDGILLMPQDAPYTSPLNEATLVMAGKPIKAYYDQNHEAHMAVHEVTLQLFSTLPPQLASQFIPAMEEHIAKHRAYHAYQQVGQAMGGIPEPIDLYASDSKEVSLEPVVENILAVEEAQRVPLLMEMLQRQVAQQQQQGGAMQPDSGAVLNQIAQSLIGIAESQSMSAENMIQSLDEIVQSQMENDQDVANTLALVVNALRQASVVPDVNSMAQNNLPVTG